jgi:hypothetical protein
MATMVRLFMIVMTLTGAWSCVSTSLPPAAAPAVTLSKSLHFVMADGSDVLVPAGTYELKPGNGQMLELVSSFNMIGQNQAIEAISTNIGQTIDGPVALYIPWENDEHHLILVQSTGDGLEAIGSTTSIRTRGMTAKPLPSSAVKKAIADQLRTHTGGERPERGTTY